MEETGASYFYSRAGRSPRLTLRNNFRIEFQLGVVSNRITTTFLQEKNLSRDLFYCG